ncbi:MAG: thioredoxin domain-containing protein [Acidobacteriota bacterium]
MSRVASILVAMVLVAFAMTACAAPTATENAESPVVARVGEVEITADDLEAEAGPVLMPLRQQMYDAKVRVLEAKIFDLLTEKAAQDAGVPKEQWLTENLAVPEPDEAEIAKVMAQYRGRLAKEDDQARKQVVDYLKQQGAQGAAADLQRQLADAAGVEIFLDPPRVEPIIGDHSPSRGPADAPIVLVEYTDFQCPFCGRVQPTLETLRERYGDSIRMVFKNLPLAMHQQAKFAAEASLCAGDQDGFWPLHDWLFANHKAINRETVLAQAAEQGLDVDALNACLDEGTHTSHVEADLKEAGSFGITGTPGFVVNGRILTGAQPLEAFIKVIDDELRRAGLPVPEPKAAEAAEETNEADAKPVAAS